MNDINTWADEAIQRLPHEEDFTDLNEMPLKERWPEAKRRMAALTAATANHEPVYIVQWLSRLASTPKIRAG